MIVGAADLCQRWWSFIIAGLCNSYKQSPYGVGVERLVVMAVRMSLSLPTAPKDLPTDDPTDCAKMFRAEMSKTVPLFFNFWAKAARLLVRVENPAVYANWL